MVLKVFVAKHRLLRNRIIGYANVRGLNIAEHVLKILKVVLWHTLQDVLLITSSADEE
jgi:hypothetical protein